MMPWRWFMDPQWRTVWLLDAVTDWDVGGRCIHMWTMQENRWGQRKATHRVVGEHSHLLKHDDSHPMWLVVAEWIDGSEGRMARLGRRPDESRSAELHVIHGGAA